MRLSRLIVAPLVFVAVLGGPYWRAGTKARRRTFAEAYADGLWTAIIWTLRVVLAAALTAVLIGVIYLLVQIVKVAIASTS